MTVTLVGLGPHTITDAGTYCVTPDATYIIDPSMEGEVKFVADPSDPAPVDFKIEMNESPDHGGDVKIKIYSSEDLSPSVTVADDYKGLKTEFDFKAAADTTFDIGDGAVFEKFEVSEDGKDVVMVGAFDREDLLKLGSLELDGNGPHDDPMPADALQFNTSWMTEEEIARLEAKLVEEGFESDGMGGWTAVDADGDGKLDEDRHVDIKLDLDGDGHDDFELKLHHWESINLTTGLDYIVEGTDNGDLIDVAYTGDPEGDMIDAGDNQTGGDEDLVDAGAGDDTVIAGEADDTVYAGSGDDSVQGNGGNDVIYGDSALGEAGGGGSVRESFEWDLAPDPNGANPIDNGDQITGFTQNTGNVDVTFSILDPNSATVTNTFETTDQNVAGIDTGGETIDDNSSFQSVTNGSGNEESYQLAFSDEVENVSFRVNDIDGDGVVKVFAYDAAGDPIEIELTLGAKLTGIDSDGDGEIDGADSNGGYEADSSSNYSMLVEIPGPVSKIVIEHSQDGSGNSGVNITDVYFDAPLPLDPEGPGNDTLEGDAGDDLIYGETGDDLIDGGTGNDTLYGDDVEGGAPTGPNLIVNGSFEDTTGMNPATFGFVSPGVMPGWTDSTGTQINVHNDERGNLEASDGNNWLDLEGTPGNNRIGQDVAGVEDGATYQLVFDAGDSEFAASSGPGENLVNVYWGGELIATIDPEQGEMTTFEFEVVGGAGDGSNRLEFEGTGDENNVGASIDDVQLYLLGDPTGPAGNDTITGGIGDDLIYGQGGDDSLSGGIGHDTLDGGEGGDTIGGAEGNDSISGGAGADSLTGGSDNDTLDGGAGNDTINGNSGNDLITDSDGDNLIDSGITGLPDLGFPYVGNADTAPTNDLDTVITGAGDDTISTGDDDDVIDAGDGDNVIDAGYDKDSITSGSGNDYIIGGEGDDTISSGGGDDTIIGGEGEPLVNLIDNNVNPINNDPILNNGDDYIDAGAGNDFVLGEDDNDTILGGAGNDTLDGGIDDDVIEGGSGDDLIIGGQGADTMSGGTGNDTFTVGTFTDPIFGDTYVEGIGADSLTPGDSIVGGEDADDGDIDVLDLTGAGPLEIVYEDSIDPTGESGESGTVTFYTDQTRTEIAGTLTFKEIENVIPCFTPGAMIATPTGEVAVETLREGDKVITRDNGIQEIRWIGNRTLNRSELQAAPNLRPILIKAGSLGDGLPERDMMVSPQHRVLASGQATQLYFAESEVLVAAKHLVGMEGIQQIDTMRTTYVHFMFDRHEVVLSDGAWTESFQPGDMTLGSMGETQRDEILALFPELASHVGQNDYASARRTLKAHEARLLQL